MTATPATVTETSVLAELTDVLGSVLDADELEFIEITMDTRFVEDLDLESIDLVTLTGELRRRYGDAVDFPAWFASLELSEIVGLSVGQVVRYVVGQLR
ncbi:MULTISPECIES: acyl carrier protein [unclassified Streptomyces]|uniref:acyl carrier protein n=1 Tax=unclassified Streptomyces TaxID=2593676 RepID=UPI00278C00E8|nr:MULTISPECIES: phosphopantetheine-binding protein [unclassified Streptomyces]